VIPIIDPRYVSGKEAKLLYSACIFVDGGQPRPKTGQTLKTLRLVRY